MLRILVSVLIGTIVAANECSELIIALIDITRSDPECMNLDLTPECMLRHPEFNIAKVMACREEASKHTDYDYGDRRRLADGET
jgi:hypothetical protein